MVDFNRDVYCVLGLPFNAVTMTQAVERVRRAGSSQQRYFLSTPNLSFLIGCVADREFRDSVI
jgi:N-acetylglucosaminyldiphosphoundecaprenol N-acetyl-beta-D-mannosaminyltransferase